MLSKMLHKWFLGGILSISLQILMKTVIVIMPKQEGPQNSHQAGTAYERRAQT